MGNLYKNIKALCDSKKVSGAKMCADTGCPKNLLTELKTGRKKTITLETAQKIADYFSVPVDRILGEKNNPSEEGFNVASYLDGLSDAQLLDLLQALTAKLAERRADK